MQFAVEAKMYMQVTNIKQTNMLHVSFESFPEHQFCKHHLSGASNVCSVLFCYETWDLSNSLQLLSNNWDMCTKSLPASEVTSKQMNPQIRCLKATYWGGSCHTVGKYLGFFHVSTLSLLCYCTYTV